MANDPIQVTSDPRNQYVGKGIRYIVAMRTRTALGFNAPWGEWRIRHLRQVLPASICDTRTFEETPAEVLWSSEIAIFENEAQWWEGYPVMRKDFTKRPGVGIIVP